MTLAYQSPAERLRPCLRRPFEVTSKTDTSAHKDLQITHTASRKRDRYFAGRSMRAVKIASFAF